jgi:hypothetical protein
MNMSVGRGLKCLICAITFLLIPWTMSASGVDDRPAADKKAESKPAGTSSTDTASEVAQLKQQLEEQQRQIQELRHLLEEQAKSTAAVNRTASSETPSSGAASSASAATATAGGGASTKSAGPDSVTLESQEAPLQFRIGTAYITPVGFMDFTSVWRSTAPGSGIGTNFGSIPLGNTTQGNLSELRFSPQNSRIGARIDAKVAGANVLAYWESDFLGSVPSNAAVSSNSDSFRLRLYWIDVRKDKWEVLGGQSWSMITPGRKGISPLPGDLFYSQDIDVNYQLGLTWSRDPQFRFVYHPSGAVAMGVSLESPEQYIGGSAGGGQITLPSALATPYASELDNGNTSFTVPGLHPDIVAKIAFDPKLPGGRALHFEIGGTARTFGVWNPLVSQHFTTTGGGGQVNLNIELFKGFRLLTNNYWSDGGGRWIFGQAPDLIVRSDGSLSAMHSGSTVSGFEFTKKNTLLYAYYGGAYIGRDSTIDAATGKFVGYGYPGSSNSQNRSIQEGTFGFTQTFWKDAKYGALSLMEQYSYLLRDPWVVLAGQPKNAKANMVFFNLRYALPGAAPALK